MSQPDDNQPDDNQPDDNQHSQPDDTWIFSDKTLS